MRLLLDTQVFLWMFLHPTKIGSKTWSCLRDAENDLYLSAASAWEIGIKVRTGKMKLPNNAALYVPRRARESNILSLPITEEHALAVTELPMEHTDPFDRMLVAQAQALNSPIVSADQIFDRYGAQRIW